jgi:hypothetical protein
MAKSQDQVQTTVSSTLKFCLIIEMIHCRWTPNGMPLPSVPEWRWLHERHVMSHDLHLRHSPGVRSQVRDPFETFCSPGSARSISPALGLVSTVCAFALTVRSCLRVEYQRAHNPRCSGPERPRDLGHDPAAVQESALPRR